MIERKNVNIKNVPVDIWSKVKLNAMVKNQTVADYLTELVQRDHIEQSILNSKIKEL